jgi:hypothetical protein
VCFGVLYFFGGKRVDGVEISTLAGFSVLWRRDIFGDGGCASVRQVLLAESGET